MFMRGATLMAQPFDPNKMTLSGEPVAIADGIDSFALANSSMFSVSNTGTLAYRGGSGPQTVLTWFDQQGRAAGTLGDPGATRLRPYPPMAAAWRSLWVPRRAGTSGFWMWRVAPARASPSIPRATMSRPVTGR